MKNILVLLAFFCAGITCASAQTTVAAEETAQQTELTKTVLKVKGATCKNDLGMIVANVQKTEGVQTCEVLKHGAVTTLEVAYDAKATDAEKIMSAVQNTGTCEDPNERRYSVKL